MIILSVFKQNMILFSDQKIFKNAAQHNNLELYFFLFPISLINIVIDNIKMSGPKDR